MKEKQIEDHVILSLILTNRRLVEEVSFLLQLKEMKEKKTPWTTWRLNWNEVKANRLKDIKSSPVKSSSIRFTHEEVSSSNRIAFD